MPKISFIIPCYYNEANIPVTSKELIENEALFPTDLEFEYIFVDDGSKDNTLAELLNFHHQYPHKVKIIKLATNVGPHNAVVAGMEYATGDCNAILAADLQDPPELIAQMYKHWIKGYKLVIGNRQDREESFFQKLFSNTFHLLIKKLALKQIPDGGYDLVLFDRVVKEEVLKIKEANSNVLYLMAWMGYEYVNIPYIRKKRELGKSRWTLKKKIKLFLDSFVAFSFFPIRAISVIGLTLGVIAFIYGIYVLAAKFLGAINVEGWTALMLVVLFVSSFQMIALGIIGEYVWRGLDAARNRPLYIIDKVY
jgi:glycosyltransferase involved in cell wall biosynthesis